MPGDGDNVIEWIAPKSLSRPLHGTVSALRYHRCLKAALRYQNARWPFGILVDKELVASGGNWTPVSSNQLLVFR